MRMRTTSRVMVASRPKVRFWPNGSTSPGNYGWLLVTIWSHLNTKIMNEKMVVPICPLCKSSVPWRRDWTWVLEKILPKIFFWKQLWSVLHVSCVLSVKS
jgi:hypothetical protein